MSTISLTINSLAGGSIIENILKQLVAMYPLCHDQAVDSYLELFKLATICHQWMECLKKPMCRTAFVVCKGRMDQYLPGAIATRYKWVTNIGFIASAGMSRETTSLLIDNGSQGWNASFTQALEEFQFSASSWDSIKTLHIGAIGRTPHDDALACLAQNLSALTRITCDKARFIYVLLAHLSTPAARNVPVACLRTLCIAGQIDKAMWSAFQHPAGKPIVFPDFAECNLHLPKLQRLCAYNALDHFRDFYKPFLDMPLCCLQVSERTHNLPYIQPVLIQSVYTLERTDTGLSNSFLTIASPVRSAVLVSLESLQLGLRDIPYHDIDCLLMQLPRLWYLHINVHNWDYPSADTAQSTSPISTTLQHLKITINCLCWLRQLIIRTPSLLKLDLPVEYSNEFVQFVEREGKNIYIWRPVVPRYGHLLQSRSDALANATSSHSSIIQRYVPAIVRSWFSLG
ncbi:hypothetical protein DL89DRAFT_265599 [Linderina pennispora]|uniref:F-box domain-containing protein n=1 Tax=Linderina pennispora TaxID=61395 RepID=A0A1Y1WEE5_9FUNG|nr:uncharacterized protein DL89DRAFT_265599 [Linderina pennispora]ORX71887.1 hypothetical protein DL89DRAFT_265599 [Linderina pennispora]